MNYIEQSEKANSFFFGNLLMPLDAKFYQQNFEIYTKENLLFLVYLSIKLGIVFFELCNIDVLCSKPEGKQFITSMRVIVQVLPSFI